MLKKYNCSKTNTTIFYKEGDSFRVFLRRSNCPMKLLKVTSDPKDAIDAYFSVKLFLLDRAYVFIDQDKKLLRSGTEPKPYSLRGFKKPANYRRKIFSTPNMPQSVHSSLLSLENITLNNRGISMSKAIILMACKLASMDEKSQIDFLRSCIPDFKNHLALSGCDNVDLENYSIKEFGENDNEDNEDDTYGELL